MNYRLKVSQGELAGSFLSRLDVFRGGVPFQVTNWSGVLAHLESYEFRPTFVADEEGAWRSISAEATERFQAILRYLGIESETGSCENFDITPTRGTLGLASSGPMSFISMKIRVGAVSTIRTRYRASPCLFSA